MYMEEALIPRKYEMEMIGHCDPISYGKSIIAFKFIYLNLFIIVSFFDHFQFLVFFVSIYIILLLDLFIYFPFLHFLFVFYLVGTIKLISIWEPRLYNT
jgi:hypothetical protein